MCVCIYLCVYICTYICIYTHIYTNYSMNLRIECKTPCLNCWFGSSIKDRMQVPKFWNKMFSIIWIHSAVLFTLSLAKSTKYCLWNIIALVWAWLSPFSILLGWSGESPSPWSPYSIPFFIYSFISLIYSEGLLYPRH